MIVKLWVWTPPESELPVVMTAVPPPITDWSSAWVMAKVWLWPLEDDVLPEIPAAGGDSTSAFWIVNVCEWPFSPLEEKALLAVEGVVGLEPHFIRPRNAKTPARAPNPVRKKFFLVI